MIQNAIDAYTNRTQDKRRQIQLLTVNNTRLNPEEALWAVAAYAQANTPSGAGAHPNEEYLVATHARVTKLMQHAQKNYEDSLTNFYVRGASFIGMSLLALDPFEATLRGDPSLLVTEIDGLATHSAIIGLVVVSLVAIKHAHTLYQRATEKEEVADQSEKLVYV